MKIIKILLLFPLLSTVIAADNLLGNSAVNAMYIEAATPEAQPTARKSAADTVSQEPASEITAEPASKVISPVETPEVTSVPAPQADPTPAPTPAATPLPQETQPADDSAADDDNAAQAQETFSVPTSYDNLVIPGINYSASVNYSNDPETAQSIVNTVGSAWIGDYGGHTIIGDHAYQGFDALTSLPIGATAYLTLNGETRTLTLASRYYGYNTTNALYTTDGTDIANIWDGDVVMYTCTDATGENIILAFWY